jgi:RNA:NAD 2'-phosphotransferase (TPT1/KptA family)
MDAAKIQNAAEALASKAAPGILRHNDKLYTFVFDHASWVYRVYEDGFFLVNFNTKRLTAAKRWLKEHVAH